jgi:hypothetical protein
VDVLVDAASPEVVREDDDVSLADEVLMVVRIGVTTSRSGCAKDNDVHSVVESQTYANASMSVHVQTLQLKVGALER